MTEQTLRRQSNERAPAFDTRLDFTSAQRLAAAVDDFLATFADGLPGRKRLKALRAAYRRLSKSDRLAYRARFPLQYSRWIRSTKPRPPPDAEEIPMFDRETLEAGHVPTSYHEKLERWHD